MFEECTNIHVRELCESVIKKENEKFVHRIVYKGDLLVSREKGPEAAIVVKKLRKKYRLNDTKERLILMATKDKITYQQYHAKLALLNQHQDLLEEVNGDTRMEALLGINS